MRPLRPVSSATAPLPPSSAMSVSSGLPGRPRAADAARNRRRISRIFAYSSSPPMASSSSSSSSSSIAGASRVFAFFFGPRFAAFFGA